MTQKLVLFFIFQSLFAGSSGKIHLWHAEKFNRILSDKLAMTLEQDFRSESSLYYVHSDIGFKYKISPNFALNINFREVFEQKDGVWISEQRPHGTISTKFKLGAFNLSARSRIEYRIKQDKDPVYRNRDMITIKSQREFTSLKLVPYIADEIFYDFEKKEINRNRAYIGFSVKSIQSFNPTIYLMQQSNYKEDQWDSILILGFKFNF
ncbi:MAG: DUF2490 domain-containing protein [Candidatus Marinimicrobia bacterium]|jgi:hypothetical protein|nr:DUF2490 domain-containing protein [Candidatus Neomarinimicrobiota bacterium]MDP6611133.1 DUF2490 domain-containing protein [Candidatus Neomarinimicrobiota bacterium]|tara:strand:- start:15621 stop:16244 length:624 start_codon:yes stop_codon:yes gene_type:complete